MSRFHARRAESEVQLPRIILGFEQGADDSVDSTNAAEKTSFAPSLKCSCRE